MSFKNRTRRLAIWTKWRLLTLLATRPCIAAIYYALVDDSLSREGAGVIAGRVRYRRDHIEANRSYYLLRRNIHRLEKGLIMRPRRKVFGIDYLEETVAMYARSITSVGSCWTSEHYWAHDVLREFFDVVDVHDPAIASAWKRFQALPAHPAGATDVRRVPYARNLNSSSPVDFDSFLQLSIRRRSVRWYLDTPVPREIVDKALEAATQAPSACNRQPFVYRIFDDPEVARKLAAIPMGTKGFAEKLPAVVVLVGRLRAYPEPRDRHAIYIDASLSAMAFIYALETLGVSTCPINWPDVQPQERLMSESLGLEPDERVIMLIAYGYPDPLGMVPYSAKRDHDQLREYN